MFLLRCTKWEMKEGESEVVETSPLEGRGREGGPGTITGILSVYKCVCL